MDVRIVVFLLATVPVGAGQAGSTILEFEKAAAAAERFLDLGCVLDGKLFGSEQARLAAALVRIAWASHAPYALDWFYSRLLTQTQTTAQEIFIRDVVRRSGSDGRALLAQLMFDPRFDAIPESALRALILQINAWLTTPLVEDPYAYVSEDQKKTTFAKWRRAALDSVQLWN